MAPDRRFLAQKGIYECYWAENVGEARSKDRGNIRQQKNSII